MPNKRSTRKKVQPLYCPHCSRRLWRSGIKHFIYYQTASELKQKLKITRKTAMLLISQNPTYVDRSCWIEGCFCEKHNNIWLQVSQDSNGNLLSRIASHQDWRCTTGTINPDLPNPSVSEFSYRQSRRAALNNLQDKKYNL